jgi:hypothetical protein
MLTHETLPQLVRDRRSEREREAQAERLALRVGATRALLTERPLQAALLGRFLAARGHALQ